MKRQMKYDRMITIFSPEGRLLQVEYAVEPVNRGGTIVGITCSEGVVLGAEEPTEDELVECDASRKLLKVYDHLGVAIAGLESDARVLVDQARAYAQSHWLTYDEPIDVEVLVKQVADLKQTYTQYARMRPFGVSMLIGGVDRTGNRLFVTHPAGTYKAYKAHAVGAGSETVMKILKEEYSKDVELNGAVQLAVECLLKAMKARGVSAGIGIALIPTGTKQFRFLTEEDIQEYKQ